MTTAPADPILVELYVEETKLAAPIVAALLHNDMEPPHRDTVDRIGFTSTQANAIGKFSTPLEAI